MAYPIRQLLSQTRYVADGSQTVWNFSFSGGYIDKSHVKAKYIDAARVEHQIAITPGMFLGQYQLNITPPIAAGSELVIYRDTPKEGPLVDFADRAALTEQALDLNAKQAVFVAAESSDGWTTIIEATTAQAVLSAAANATAAASRDAAAVSAANALTSKQIVVAAQLDVTTNWGDKLAEAAVQAGIATRGGNTATTQAGISTTQAGISTTQAGISTTQAGLAAVAKVAAELAAEQAQAATAGGRATVVTGDGTTDKSAELAAANAQGQPIRIVGVLVIGTATTITAPITDTMAQIFSAGSLITINNSLPVRPEWWGNGQRTIEYAVNALPSTGGIVQLEDKTYLPNGFIYGFGGVGSGKYISKPNVTIQGRKMPVLANDCKSLTGGTIIQGTVLAYANNIEFRDVGVDCGYTVVQNYHGGVAAAGVTEGLLITYPDAATKSASTMRVGVRLHNVIGLCASPTSPTHAIIAGEGVTDVSCTGEIIGCYGVHGVVFKCRNAKAESISAYCNGDDGLIIKSDIQATSQSYRISIGKVVSRAEGPEGTMPYLKSNTGYGVLFDAAGKSIDDVHINSIRTSGYPTSVAVRFGGNYSISSVHIGTVLSDQGTASGVRHALSLMAAAGQNIVRFDIGTLDARFTTIGVNASFQQPGERNNYVSIGRLKVVYANNAVAASGASIVSIGDVYADGCTDGVYKIIDTAKLKIGNLNIDNTTYPVYSTAGLVPALANGWTQYAGNDPFGVDLTGYRVNLRGLIVPGSSNIVARLPAWARPASVKRGIAQANALGGVTGVSLTVSTDGRVLVNEVAGGYANCRDWLSLGGISFDMDN